MQSTSTAKGKLRVLNCMAPGWVLDFARLRGAASESLEKRDASKDFESLNYRKRLKSHSRDLATEASSFSWPERSPSGFLLSHAMPMHLSVINLAENRVLADSFLEKSPLSN